MRMQNKSQRSFFAVSRLIAAFQSSFGTVKNNFWHMDFKYVQPALSANQKPVDGLWLTISPQRVSVDEVPAKLVADIVYDYVKYAMCIDEPRSCAEYLNMENEITAKGTVKLSKII